ncbi:LPXTG cell wall anchor domain-containing protein [Listeria sp. FSL L7-0091]|uniref:leucine-rich repeat domain-containing protein n=1 Tax=Listeria farberi TaxID=2713500 RepID=UPI001625C2D9|nr:leucine-rich repeat domain-containing protein [Listeria farberi]MBC2262708.1 LPXTG cell wall anchor domain-containing protein [Listeria farberi]
MKFPREEKQKNWRMWKKGKQWICGAALFFTVVASPGMLVLADEVNTGNSTTVTAGADAMSSTEIMDSTQQEENTVKGNKTKIVEGKKAKSKTGRTITQPTAISDLFPDANLAEVMRVRLNKASVSDMVTQNELNGITTLSSNGNNFATISGLEHLTNLTNLTLYNDQISDISVLSALTNLTNLRIDNNQISDISALSGMTNLTNLTLDSNQINDISALSSMTNLTHLSLSRNQISDITALSGITNLTSLNLGYNQINDVSALNGMTNLTNLTLISNQINDISMLSGMTNLINLSLSYNQINDISVLSDMTNLISLSLSNNQISDISALSGLTNLTTLNFSRNQISDITALSDLTNLTSLHMTNNQISDISVLNASQFTILSAINQQINLSGIKWSNQLEIPFTVNDTEDNNEITPSSISNNGQFIDDVITWNGLSNNAQQLSYSWNRYSTANRQFSGTVSIRVEPVAVKILIDNDGNRNTTEDQALFAEQSSGLDSLEAMYNYGKNQLNGTGYGLISIETDSHGDCVILVSQVGTLKKVDSNGSSLGTSVPYTPTYTVTGTGDDAELVASYEVSVDAPPTGYVYIYGKGTTQEVRFTSRTPVTIPLTDTNSNGKPQWQEDYTVVQYQRAGALNPTTPGGSQIPGGSISIPEDAVEGDLITLPDTITGSDGREYVVDSSVDTDANTPGVQITLTDEEQAISYFDFLLSESEASTSESNSMSESESTTTGITTSETDTANSQGGTSVGPISAQNGKLAKTGDISMLSLQGVGVGLLASLSGLLAWTRRKKKA